MVEGLFVPVISRAKASGVFKLRSNGGKVDEEGPDLMRPNPEDGIGKDLELNEDIDDRGQRHPGCRNQEGH